MSLHRVPRLGAFVLAGLVCSLAGGSADAGPPSNDPPTDPGARTSGGQAGSGQTGTGVSVGGFSPPSGATFDPNTTADPGVLDRPSSKTEDRTYGATGNGERAGYDIIDSQAYQVDTGYDAEIPDYHIVQDGDTLSGICEYYYGDLYLWPKVWSYNPNVTNPHWIFPGDRVRLTDPYATDDSTDGPGLGYAATYDPRDAREQTYVLERYAFIDDEELSKSMEIIGGADAKVMMATLDTAYIGYDEKNPPIPGERLSVYRTKQPVYDIKLRKKGQQGQHQKKGKRIGWLVEVVGEVYVTSVAKKSAEADIVDSVQPVERGLRVGELKTRFSRVSATENEVTANGVVVETIRDATITGEDQFVIVNLGSDDGVRRGNTLEVVEKGDAYTSDHRMHQPYEEGHPRRVLANLMVLQVEDDSALTAVTFSLQEIEIGNHVEITEAGEKPDDHEPYDPKRKANAKAKTSGEGSVSDEDAELKGGGALKLGN